MASDKDPGQLVQKAFNSPLSAHQVTNLGSLVDKAYDYISVAYPSGTQEVYTFKTGGSGGTTVYTLTVDYTDSTKINLSAVTRA